MTDRAWSGDRIRHLEFLGISELESPHLQKKKDNDDIYLEGCWRG